MSIDTTEFLVDQLIVSARRRAFMPRSDLTYTAAEMLEVFNEEMRTYIVPFMREVHEEYWVRTLDVSVAAGATEFRIPSRAAGEALKAIQIQSGSDWVGLTRVQPENALRICGNAFSLEDDRVVLVAAPTATTTYRVKFIMRPSKLVLAADCIRIQEISENRLFITPGASTGSRFTNGGFVDVVAGQPGFRTLVFDFLASSPVIDVVFPLATANPLPVGAVVAGDYLCIAGESPFPPVPPEVGLLLAQRVAVKMLEGKGGTNYELVSNALMELRAGCLSLLTDRTETTPHFVQNFHAPGWSASRYRMRAP